MNKVLLSKAILYLINSIHINIRITIKQLIQGRAIQSNTFHQNRFSIRSEGIDISSSIQKSNNSGRRAGSFDT